MLEVTLTSGCAAMFDVFNNLMCITIDGNFDVSASSYDVTTMIEARPQLSWGFIYHHLFLLQ